MTQWFRTHKQAAQYHLELGTDISKVHVWETEQDKFSEQYLSYRKAKPDCSQRLRGRAH